MGVPGSTMYLKDKNTRITLRVNQDQFNFIKGKAEVLGVSPSEYLRMMVNVHMFNENNKEENRRANEEAYQHNFV